MKREHLLWLAATSAGAAPLLEFGQGSNFEYEGLRFGLDRQFKMTVFEDLHFGEESWWQDCPDCAGYDAKTTKVMDDILGWEKTDLAVLNGDLLSAEAVSPDNYTQYIDRLVQPLVRRDVPWASTYGNHDRSPNTSPRDLLAEEKSYNKPGHKKLAWTESLLPGEDAQVGSTNYYIPIYSSSGGGNPNLVLILWFFDSRAGVVKDGPLEDFVAPEVVAWYMTQKTALYNAYHRVIPSLAFVHIPFKASLNLQQRRKKNNRISPGLDDEIIGHQANTCDQSGGNCNYNSKDIPFMKALVGTDGLMAVFSGHDHNIDWCMKWANDLPFADTTPSTGNGLNVCFGRRTGYGGYNKKHAKGARRIVIHEDGLDKKEVETWIRLEDGSISGSITLNATFGQDRYPLAPEQSRGGSSEGTGEGAS